LTGLALAGSAAGFNVELQRLRHATSVARRLRTVRSIGQQSRLAKKVVDGELLKHERRHIGVRSCQK